MTDIELILTKLGEISTSQARAEEKQKATHADVIEIKTDVKKQNGRVRKLENKYNYFIGALSILGIVGGLIWTLL